MAEIISVKERAATSWRSERGSRLEVREAQLIRRIALDSTLSRRRVEGEPPPNMRTVLHTGTDQTLVQFE